MASLLETYGNFYDNPVMYKVTLWSTDNPELVGSKCNGYVNAFNACKPLSLRDASIEIYRARVRIRDSAAVQADQYLYM